MSDPCFTLGATHKDELGIPTVGLRNFVSHPDLETALTIGGEMIYLCAAPAYIDASRQEGIVIHYD